MRNTFSVLSFLYAKCMCCSSMLWTEKVRPRPTVRSVIIGTFDKHEQKRLYKINYTNTELYFMELYYFILQELLREIYFV